MSALAQLLEAPIGRYILSGSLITLYLVFDLLGRWRGPRRPSPHPPRWLHPLVLVSVTGFYALIGPTGGPLGGGLVNLAGAGLVLVAAALRLSRAVRFPELAGRGLLYVALPMAAGVPWGWLVLSLPATVASIVVCRRADRLAAASGEPLPRYRMLPGIW